jgi:hypothetical protein
LIWCLSRQSFILGNQISTAESLKIPRNTLTKKGCQISRNIGHYTFYHFAVEQICQELHNEIVGHNITINHQFFDGYARIFLHQKQNSFDLGLPPIFINTEQLTKTEYFSVLGHLLIKKNTKS